MTTSYKKDDVDHINQSPVEEKDAYSDKERVTQSQFHSKDPETVSVLRSRKTKHSDAFTILAAGSALISDGYQNNVQTMLNTLFAKRYGSKVYTSAISTRLSNSLLVGCVLGQVIVGLMCDRIGRKSAILTSTLLLAVGSIFATGAIPVDGNLSKLWWWLTVSTASSMRPIFFSSNIFSSSKYTKNLDCTRSNRYWIRRRVPCKFYFSI